MGTKTFVRRSRIEAPAATVFRWHARPGALERLIPPWSGIRVIERVGGIEAGARVALRMPLGPIHTRWVAEHRECVEGKTFQDVQVHGPFARWVHTHRFEPDGPSASVLEDHIEYAMPLGILGATVGGAFARATLDATFTYRHRLTADDIGLHQEYGMQPRHVAVTGASGLIGSALVPFLTTGGHRVTRLVRDASKSQSGIAHWNPTTGTLTGPLDGLEAVVHLAGEGIANKRWSAARKAAIKDSRVQPTRTLSEALARMPQPPRVLVCASAIGFYGDRGAETVDEDSPSGDGFLAEVCREWEAATAPASAAGIRVVNLRFGVVLTSAGGALAKMLPPIRFGVGGPLGSGGQYMSWIAIDDVVGVVLHALATEKVRGPVNVVAPAAVTNHDLTRTLGRILTRPTVLPVPAAAARLAFGEMADEALLASTRVAPTRLAASGYRFRHPNLEDALRHTLGKG
jgi:uncharacterized protein (TIGR01777 family)